MNTVSLHDNSDKSDRVMAKGAQRALLDSGTTYSLLPTQLYNNLASIIGASSSGLISADCNRIGNITLSFNFQGFDISIPLSGFVVDQESDTCTLGLASTDDLIILGDSFLSNIYFVADLDDNQIALALANPDSTTENIEAIKDTIPSATTCVFYSSTDVSSLSVMSLSSTAAHNMVTSESTSSASPSTTTSSYISTSSSNTAVGTSSTQQAQHDDDKSKSTNGAGSQFSFIGEIHMLAAICLIASLIIIV
ncbi:unnamed protein product [Ambrosiozyma monospora]|uniref:Unnamed protein product n=1 Tax=Ambrosiozyma monospora TaxID=43982 RepID=A0A9W7DGG7_AMBMO|nr:unnamed protein product [Ambrosiozyma monospora]